MDSKGDTEVANAPEEIPQPEEVNDTTVEEQKPAETGESAEAGEPAKPKKKVVKKVKKVPAAKKENTDGNVETQGETENAEGKEATSGEPAPGPKKKKVVKKVKKVHPEDQENKEDVPEQGDNPPKKKVVKKVKKPAGEAGVKENTADGKPAEGDATDKPKVVRKKKVVKKVKKPVNKDATGAQESTEDPAATAEDAEAEQQTEDPTAIKEDVTNNEKPEDDTTAEGGDKAASGSDPVQETATAEKVEKPVADQENTNDDNSWMRRRRPTVETEEKEEAKEEKDSRQEEAVEEKPDTVQAVSKDEEPQAETIDPKESESAAGNAPADAAVVEKKTSSDKSMKKRGVSKGKSLKKKEGAEEDSAAIVEKKSSLNKSVKKREISKKSTKGEADAKLPSGSSIKKSGSVKSRASSKKVSRENSKAKEGSTEEKKEEVKKRTWEYLPDKNYVYPKEEPEREMEVVKFDARFVPNKDKVEITENVLNDLKEWGYTVWGDETAAEKEKLKFDSSKITKVNYSDARAARWNGEIIAKSPIWKEVDGRTFFPRRYVNKELIRPSKTKTFTPWLGLCEYSTVVGRGKENRDAAFQYRNVKKIIEGMEGWYGFRRGVKIDVARMEIPGFAQPTIVAAEESNSANAKLEVKSDDTPQQKTEKVEEESKPQAVANALETETSKAETPEVTAGATPGVPAEVPAAPKEPTEDSDGKISVVPAVSLDNLTPAVVAA